MAADADNRLAFAADCKRVIDEFGLDGIDIDWNFLRVTWQVSLRHPTTLATTTDDARHSSRL